MRLRSAGACARGDKRYFFAFIANYSALQLFRHLSGGKTDDAKMGVRAPSITPATSQTHLIGKRWCSSHLHRGGARRNWLRPRSTSQCKSSYERVNKAARLRSSENSSSDLVMRAIGSHLAARSPQL